MREGGRERKREIERIVIDENEMLKPFIVLRNFFERNGKAYCEEDYHNMFSPRCAGCNGAIKDVSSRVSFYL